MKIKVEKSNIKGKVIPPYSKSYAHRFFIASALSECFDFEKGLGKDTDATAECLEKLKPYILYESSPDHVILNARESGSTLRFLLPVVSALGAECTFIGEGQLNSRPIDKLQDVLSSNGAKITSGENGNFPLKVSGKLNSGVFDLRECVSSQYITGLLFALPLLKGDSEIFLPEVTVSSNYVDMTLDCLKNFGIVIEKTVDGFKVAGGQTYRRPNGFSIERDWSSAGFLIALGTLFGEVKIGGLNEKSLQGDRVITDILKGAGADISYLDCELICRKSRLHGVTFNAENCPDAVPVMAAILSYADGVSKIFGVERLKIKECDRLSATLSMLNSFGIKAEYVDGAIVIEGGIHHAASVDGFNDHRMAMSEVVLALGADGVSEISGVECMAKSYPSFLSDAINLGAKIEYEK